MLFFYSGLGRWFYDDVFSNPEAPPKIYLTDEYRETGLFKLGNINQQELRYSGKTTACYLKSCNEHEDGVDEPYFPQIPAVNIAYFEPNEPINITDKDIFKENIGIKNSQSNKKRKVLIENQRATTELLLLIYQIFNKHNLKVGVDDETRLPAIKAWGLILSGEFESDLIQRIDGERDAAFITLNGGDIVYETDFKRTYIRRFK